MKRNTFKKLGFYLNKWIICLLVTGFAALNTGFTTQVDEIKAAEVAEVVETAEAEAVEVLPDSVVAKDEFKLEDVANVIDTDGAAEDVVARDIPIEDYNADENYVDLADYVEPEPEYVEDYYYSSEPEYADVLSMEATAYLPSDGNGDGLTAMGIPATYGVVAVDPYVIPLGTRLYIPGYGEAIAADTGGAIYGYRIDLCMESYSEAINFGRRNVTVYILR